MASKVLPRLGHDRDEPARHARLALKPEYARLGGEERLDIQMKQGTCAIRVEINRRRCRQGAAARRQDLRPGLKVRALPWPGLLQGGRRDPRPGTGFFEPGRRGDHRPLRLTADHRPRQGRHQSGGE